MLQWFVANLDKLWVKLNSFCGVSDGISISFSFDVCLVPEVNTMSNVTVVSPVYDFAPGLGW